MYVQASLTFMSGLNSLSLPLLDFNGLFDLLADISDWFTLLKTTANDSSTFSLIFINCSCDNDDVNFLFIRCKVIKEKLKEKHGLRPGNNKEEICLLVEVKKPKGSPN